MTRKEAAEKLKALWYFLINNDYPQKDLDALKVAIKALEQELRDCKTCIHSDKGKCAGTEECHECMWESKYEQQPCDDCISRAEAVDACLNRWNKDYTEIVEDIRHLSSVTPQQRMGRWEEYYTFLDPMTPRYRCSICQEPMEKVLCGDQLVEWWSDYCPNCGAKMEVKE